MGFETRRYGSSYEGGTVLAAAQLGLSVTAAGIAIASTVLAFTSQESYSAQGVVHLGANGREYVIPQGAERPVYKSLGACVTDVTAQLGAIEEATGQKVQETPQQLCQPVEEFQGSGRVAYYPRGYSYGPIVNPGSVWKSKAIVQWQTAIPDGTFAAPGTHVQVSLRQAPSGLRTGAKTTITNPDEGGFGEHSSGGFTRDGSDIGTVHGGGVVDGPPHIVVPHAE